MAPNNSVFISYRREGGFAWAQLVWNDLRDHGIDAFLDLEDVRDAGNFDAKILNQIDGRPYFILVMTHGALERCRNPKDWLRLELLHAIDTDRVIVPLIISGFDFSEVDAALPEDAASALRSANGIDLVPEFFKAAMERLRDDRLEPIEAPVRPLSPVDLAFAEDAHRRASDASEDHPQCPCRPRPLPELSTFRHQLTLQVRR